MRTTPSRPPLPPATTPPSATRTPPHHHRASSYPRPNPLLRAAAPRAPPEAAQADSSSCARLPPTRAEVVLDPVKGDIFTRAVVLDPCWSSGRRMAAQWSSVLPCCREAPPAC
ncbi:hypothetical protein VPH35_027918 [Triticum aestivum]